MIFVALVAALALAGPQQPPRDRTVSPGIVLDDAAQEAELAKRIAASPAGITAYQQLARLQEERGAYAEAEATLIKARQVAPKAKPVVMSLAAMGRTDSPVVETRLRAPSVVREETMHTEMARAWVAGNVSDD